MNVFNVGSWDELQMHISNYFKINLNMKQKSKPTKKIRK